MHVYMYAVYHAVCMRVSITHMIRENMCFYSSAFLPDFTNQSAKKLTEGGYVCKASMQLSVIPLLIRKRTAETLKRCPANVNP